jgi:hypothetical protein
MKRLFAVGVMGLLSSYPAHAGEHPFGYSYTAETEEPGETELSLWATDRRGKGEGHYDAQDYRLEIERGLTDRFQTSVYVNLVSHHVRGLAPELDPVKRNLAFQGASLEFKYRLLDQAPHGIALALYVEPGWSRIRSIEGAKGTEYELEFKIIASKSLGRLLWAGNLTFEPEWELERDTSAGAIVDHHWATELKLEATTGLAYRLSPQWSAGVEARYASVYPNWTHGLHREAYAVSAGPTIAFNAGEFSASLAYLPQLFGGPSPNGARTFGEFEKREIRLRLSKGF